ncbi:MAG: GNAT family N-acetyltransferase [Clostridiales bacterium]|nr:GNAT family N-acetyltransferase [Clostridiales bacterium]
MAVKIRPMSAGDMAQVLALYREFYGEMAALAPKYVQKAEQDEGYLRAVCESDEDEVFVAECDGTVVGVMVLQSQETPPYDNMVFYRYGCLMDIMVAPQYRSKGIGKGLLDAAKSWCREQQLSYLELEVLKSNKRAMEFYLREGFLEETVTMRMGI